MQYWFKVDKYAELATDLAGPSCSSNTAGVYSNTGNAVPLQNQSKSPLDRAYQAKVLAHYPEERVGFPFVQEVVSVCLFMLKVMLVRNKECISI